jgi:hypothetical protein
MKDTDTLHKSRFGAAYHRAKPAEPGAILIAACDRRVVLQDASVTWLDMRIDGTMSYRCDRSACNPKD